MLKYAFIEPLFAILYVLRVKENFNSLWFIELLDTTW